MTVSGDSRARIVGPTTWLVCFAVATVLALVVALQRWSGYQGPNKPPSFWNARFIHPQLIQWYAWAAIAPMLMMVLDRLPLGQLQSWRRAGVYVALGTSAIVLHATMSGFALGWWWSFPSLVPTDPAWHIADQLKNRTTMSLLVVWLIAAMYHARARASIASPPPAPALPPQSSTTISPGPLSLRTADRVVFVDAHDVTWIEADGDYVIVHTSTANHRIRETITSMEARVPSELLVRISRSAIVNLSAIREMQRWFRGNFVVILRDGTRVTTGSRFRDRLIRRI